MDSQPTVPRPSSPRARINWSTSVTTRAAATSASRRAEGGVVPAWLSWPMMTRVVPDLCLCTRDDADLLALALQDRPLFDMQFEIGIGREGLRRVRRPCSRCCPARRRPTRHPRRAAHRSCRGDRSPAQMPEPISERPKRRAFLVGPVDQFDRRLGGDVEVGQRAHHLEPGDHAERTVELAPVGWLSRWLPSSTGRRCRVAALAAGEHVADGVHAHGQAQRLAPAAEGVAALPVDIGERQAPHAALGRGADLAPWPSGCPTAACRRCAGWCRSWLGVRPAVRESARVLDRPARNNPPAGAGSLPRGGVRGVRRDRPGRARRCLAHRALAAVNTIYIPSGSIVGTTSRNSHRGCLLGK